jgi:arginyl-tRNA synthetase
LKVRVGGDLHYDPKDSVSLEGNSGPYLQYAHARARSILRKTTHEVFEAIVKLEDDERRLVRKVSEYPEVLEKAVAEHMPHYVCTYLYELAQAFNRFYEKNRVIDSEREQQRVQLVRLYADVLKDGLDLLGIPAPERL